MENRHGLAVGGTVTQANGMAEREASENMLKATVKRLRRGSQSAKKRAMTCRTMSPRYARFTSRHMWRRTMRLPKPANAAAAADSLKATVFHFAKTGGTRNWHSHVNYLPSRAFEHKHRAQRHSLQPVWVAKIDAEVDGGNEKCKFYPLEHVGLLARRRRFLVRQQLENAPLIAQGCAGLRPSPADRAHCVTCLSRRTSSPIRPNLSFRHTQAVSAGARLAARQHRSP
jgi:hypothetical protein